MRILAAFLLLASLAAAQDPRESDSDLVPAAPAGAQHAERPDPPVIPTVPLATLEHRFWDRENILLFSGVAVFRGLDYASTQNFMARGRTEVLIPDDVVKNKAGFASLEAAATMTSVGISYIFHRTGHHKMERWLSIGHISVTGFGVVSNYSLETKRFKR